MRAQGPSTMESTQAESLPGTRLVFLDVLRVAIVVMVIVHHAAQAYGPTGGTWPISDPASSDWFRPFYTVNAAVGLGMLFLLAGYFVPPSFDRKGPVRFLRERWARIGVPLVVFALVIHLPVVWLTVGRPPLGEFVAMLYQSGWQGVYLHLWFLGHLLLYSAVYVAWRRFTDRGEYPTRLLRPPGHVAIVGLVVALAVVTWVVRWWYPVDEWVPLFFLLATEPANLAQYLSLFVLGIVSYQNDWLRRIPRRVGMTWLGVGITASLAVFTLEAMGRWDHLVATGGLNARSLLRTSLEALICAGLSVGLVVLARELFHRPWRLLTTMAAASYAAYILHLWIVTGVQAGILAFEAPAVAKFALVAVLGTIFSFGIGHLSGKVPVLRVILAKAPANRRASHRLPADQHS